MAEKVHVTISQLEQNHFPILGPPLPLKYTNSEKPHLKIPIVRLDSPLPLKYQIRSISDPPMSSQQHQRVHSRSQISSVSFGDPLPLEYLSKSSQNQNERPQKQQTHIKQQQQQQHKDGGSIRREDVELRQRVKEKLQHSNYKRHLLEDLKHLEEHYEGEEGEDDDDDVIIGLKPSIANVETVHGVEEGVKIVNSIEERIEELETRVFSLEQEKPFYFKIQWISMTIIILIVISLLIAD